MSGSNAGASPSWCAAASASIQSANQGLRGRSGPCRYVPDDAAGPAALVSARAVVPEPGEHAPERLCSALEIRPAGVVLEAGQRLSGPFALQQDIPDHAPLTGDGMEREETAPGQLRTGPVAVVAPEQLVAAAHGEEGRAAGDRVLERRALGFDVGCDERLLAILAAADVVQVDLASVHALADADRGDLELMAASCGTLASTAMLPRSA